MPIKYNLTKYDMLSSKIKKAAVIKNPKEMGNGEKNAMLKAVLIASFASGHSWQTHKALASPSPISLNNPDIKKEFQEAIASKWKSITPFDIVEVSNTGISERMFSEWLFFNVDKDYHDDYKAAWEELKADFREDCDSVERN